MVHSYTSTHLTKEDENYMCDKWTITIEISGRNEQESFGKIDTNSQREQNVDIMIDDAVDDNCEDKSFKNKDSISHRDEEIEETPNGVTFQVPLELSGKGKNGTDTSPFESNSRKESTTSAQSRLRRHADRKETPSHKIRLLVFILLAIAHAISPIHAASPFDAEHLDELIHYMKRLHLVEIVLPIQEEQVVDVSWPGNHSEMEEPRRVNRLRRRNRFARNTNESRNEMPINDSIIMDVEEEVNISLAEIESNLNVQRRLENVYPQYTEHPAAAMNVTSLFGHFHNANTSTARNIQTTEAEVHTILLLWRPNLFPVNTATSDEPPSCLSRNHSDMRAPRRPSNVRNLHTREGGTMLDRNVISRLFPEIPIRGTVNNLPPSGPRRMGGTRPRDLNEVSVNARQYYLGNGVRNVRNYEVIRQNIRNGPPQNCFGHNTNMSMDTSSLQDEVTTPKNEMCGTREKKSSFQTNPSGQNNNLRNEEGHRSVTCDMTQMPYDLDTNTSERNEDLYQGSAVGVLTEYEDESDVDEDSTSEEAIRDRENSQQMVLQGQNEEQQSEHDDQEQSA